MVSLQVDVSEKYKCPICYEIEDSMQLVPCGHNVCMCCITKIKGMLGNPIRIGEYNEPFSCPICRSSCSYYPDKRMKRELDNETINCGKCQEKMSFNKYHSHLTQNCPCFFIECRMCKEQVVYRDFLNHSQICSKHPVECKCKAILAREDLPLHEKYYCVKSAELLHTDCKICGKSVAITVFQSHYVQEHLKRTMIAQILPKLTFK